MKLNCCFVSISFLILIHTSTSNAVEQHNDQSPNREQVNQPNQLNSIKKEENEEDKKSSNPVKNKEPNEPSVNRPPPSDDTQSNDKATSSWKEIPAVDPTDETNDESNEEYIYIKIKSINVDDKSHEELDEDETHTPIKDSPIRKTMNIVYDDKFKRLDKTTLGDEENSKEKEVMIADVYPKIDLLKVEFKRNEKTQKIPEEDEEEPAPKELTKEQLLGKQLFEDALTKLDLNQKVAYKLMDQASLLGYKEATEFLLHGLMFNDFGDFGVSFLLEKLDYHSRRGNSLAQMFIGFFYASGIIFKPSQANALLYYTMSSAANNTYAQMALGYRYWYGINVKQNCQKALKYYRKVAKQVEKTMSTIPGGIIERKRLFDENENPTSYSVLNPDMIQYYQVLAENGDTLAQIAVGQIHYQGMRGVPKDHRKALKFLKMAADSKNSNAMAYLGKVSFYLPLLLSNQ